MHLAERGYLLVALTAVLAVIAIWSDDSALRAAWVWPLMLLLLGVAYESTLARSTKIQARLSGERRVYLGREQAAAFEFLCSLPRPVTLLYAPATPAGFAALGEPRTVQMRAQQIHSDAVNLTGLRLGRHAWPALPARLLGALGLMWWSRDLDVAGEMLVAPDVLRVANQRVRGTQSGARARRSRGAGTELLQLRPYAAGDPITRIDWKSTARLGELVTREYSEDQHLDLMIVIDAGRLSRVRAGSLDRLGLYANIAARFAQHAIARDDRVGLVVFSDRVIATCAPDRGVRAVIAIRRTLERLSAEPAESNPVAAARHVRGLIRQRSLIALLTDLDDPTVAAPLARAVRLLTPPHLAMLAGVRSTEIIAMRDKPVTSWRDPWISIAAGEHESRASAQRLMLRRLGAPVVAAREDLLEDAVLAEYERLRQLRRI